MEKTETSKQVKKQVNDKNKVGALPVSKESKTVKKVTPVKKKIPVTDDEVLEQYLADNDLSDMTGMLVEYNNRFSDNILNDIPQFMMYQRRIIGIYIDVLNTKDTRVFNKRMNMLLFFFNRTKDTGVAGASVFKAFTLQKIGRLSSWTGDPKLLVSFKLLNMLFSQFDEMTTANIERLSVDSTLTHDHISRLITFIENR